MAVRAFRAHLARCPVCWEQTRASYCAGDLAPTCAEGRRLAFALLAGAGKGVARPKPRRWTRQDQARLDALPPEDLSFLDEHPRGAD